MTQSKEATGYHGYRYLVDANDDRQYAVRFDNGKPVRPIHVFAINQKNGEFKANETIFAFDDETEVRMAGGLRVSTTLFQIKTGSNGSPLSLKMAAAEYDVGAVSSGKTVELTYKMTLETQARLKDMGFDANYPQKFVESMNPLDRAFRSQGGVLQVDSSVVQNLSFPPHHDCGALIARQNVEALQEPAAKPEPKAPAPAREFKMADEQTLVETKTLGAGSKMKLVFNFEARRVSEVYESGAKEAAITGYSFAEYDRGGLEAAYERLVALKGKPKPLDDKAAPRLQKTP